MRAVCSRTVRKPHALAESLESRTHLSVAAPPALLITTESTILKIAADGTRTTFASGIYDYAGVEVLGSTTYAVNSGRTAILGFNEAGTQISSIPVPVSITTIIGFSALSDGRFALYDNDNDNVYFLGSDGTLLHTTAIKSPADTSLQSMSGVEVGTQLIVSNDGDLNIVAFDLSTYAASTFKTISTYVSWIGAIDFSGSTYYVCGPTKVLQFTQAGSDTTLATFTNGNLTGIVSKDGYAFVTHNGDDAVYRVDLSSGAVSSLYSSVTYPKDIELAPLPVATAPLVISGTEGDDEIILEQTGDDLAVTINGGAATHHSVSLISTLTINALGGNDIVNLGGVDTSAAINGGGGNDSLYGGFGDDTIRGGLGDDVIYGDGGSDQIFCGEGADEAHGNQQNDEIFGADGADSLYGGMDDDFIRGQGKADLIHGGPGNDQLQGDAGNDSLYGDGGDDSLQAIDDPAYFIDFGDGGVGDNIADHDDNDDILNCLAIVPV